MLRVVTSKGVAVERAVLERDDPQTLPLEAADDLAHETSLDRVGLADDERAIHGRGGYRPLSRIGAREHTARDAGRQSWISASTRRAGPIT